MVRSMAKFSFATPRLGRASMTVRSSAAPSARRAFSAARASRKASFSSSLPESVTNSSTLSAAALSRPHSLISSSCTFSAPIFSSLSTVRSASVSLSVMPTSSK